MVVGGGQFALICKSVYPNSKTYLVDIIEDSVLEQYTYYNNVINYSIFENEGTKFDFIFLNDVFEHVNDPVKLLDILRNKLTANGKIFIDTPRQTFIYKLLEIINKPLYEKLLKGTVSKAHLQIYSDQAFKFICTFNKLKIDKYQYKNEFTMFPDYYIKNMGISNKILINLSRSFYKYFKFLFKNKIYAVLSSESKSKRQQNIYQP